MNYLRQDRIGEIAVRRVNGDDERRVCTKIGLNFGEMDCRCHCARFRRRGGLHTVLVRYSSHHPFIHGADSGSSVPLTVKISKESVTRAFPKSASVTRPRREDDPLAHYPPLPLASLATLRLGRISDASRHGN